MDITLAIILIIAALIVGIALGIVFYDMKHKDAKKQITGAEEEATRIVNDLLYQLPNLQEIRYKHRHLMLQR